MSKCILLLILLIFYKVHSTQVTVAVHRIPNQPSQLVSGGSVVLLCTVTTTIPNSIVQVQWYNGSQEIQETHSIHITEVYMLLNGTWQSSLEISVLTFHASWYYCKATDSNNTIHYGSIQMFAEDSSATVNMNLEYPSISFYAKIPFHINCTITLPNQISLPLTMQWYRNGEQISPLKNNIYIIETARINSTSLKSTLIVTEPLPAVNIHYTCTCTAEAYGIHIFTLNRTTSALTIAIHPTPQFTISTIPNTGPVAGMLYTVICSVTKPVSGVLSVKWKNNNGLLVKTFGNIRVGSPVQTDTGANLTLEFIKVTVVDEDTYVCHSSLILENYQLTVSDFMSFDITAPAQILSMKIIALPQTDMDWYSSTNAALVCTVETNTGDVSTSLHWTNSTGSVISNAHIKSSGTVSISNTIYQSALEFQPLQAHADLYYCVATIGSSMKEQWYYINVLSDLPSITITLLDESPSLMIPTVGEPYILSCITTRPSNIQTLPTVVWTRYTGAMVQSDSSHYLFPISINNTHVVSKLRFQPLLVTDAGRFICTVTYNVPGSTEDIYGKSSTTLQIKAPSPVVTMETSDSQHKMTCNIKLNSTGNIFVSVTTHWYLLTKLGQLVNPDEDTNLYMSELSSISCGRFYSQYIEADSGTIWSQYSSVVCEVTVDIDDIPDVISSVTRANISNNTIPVSPLQPIAITIKDIGSRWVEIIWSIITENHGETYIIEYREVDIHRGQTSQYQLSNRVYQSIEDTNQSRRHYLALLTDLHPGTLYDIRVIAETSIGLIKSEVVNLVTNETAPTGTPLNFTYELLRNGSFLFYWNPPDTDKQNGLIISYYFYCTPSIYNKTSTEIATINTSLLLNGIVLGTNYSCSVTAVNSAGEGPRNTLQFSLSIPREGGVEEEDQDFFLNVYSAILVGAVILVAMVIIVPLVVAVCYYKRKLNNYFIHVCKGSPPSSSPPQTPTNPLDSSSNQASSTSRYVSTETLELLWQRRNHPQVDSPPCSNALELDLKRQESNV